MNKLQVHDLLGHSRPQEVVNKSAGVEPSSNSSSTSGSPRNANFDPASAYEELRSLQKRIQDRASSKTSSPTMTGMPQPPASSFTPTAPPLSLGPQAYLMNASQQHLPGAQTPLLAVPPSASGASAVAGVPGSQQLGFGPAVAPSFAAPYGFGPQRFAAAPYAPGAPGYYYPHYYYNPNLYNQYGLYQQYAVAQQQQQFLQQQQQQHQHQQSQFQDVQQQQQQPIPTLSQMTIPLQHPLPQKVEHKMERPSLLGVTSPDHMSSASSLVGSKRGVTSGGLGHAAHSSFSTGPVQPVTKKAKSSSSASPSVAPSLLSSAATSPAASPIEQVVGAAAAAAASADEYHTQTDLVSYFGLPRNFRFRDARRTLLDRTSATHRQYIETVWPHNAIVTKLPHRLTVKHFATCIWLITFHYLCIGSSASSSQGPSFWADLTPADKARIQAAAASFASDTLLGGGSTESSTSSSGAAPVSLDVTQVFSHERAREIAERRRRSPIAEKDQAAFFRLMEDMCPLTGLSGGSSVLGTTGSAMTSPTTSTGSVSAGGAGGVGLGGVGSGGTTAMGSLLNVSSASTKMLSPLLDAIPGISGHHPSGSLLVSLSPSGSQEQLLTMTASSKHMVPPISATTCSVEQADAMSPSIMTNEHEVGDDSPHGGDAHDISQSSSSSHEDFHSLDDM